MQLIDDYLRAVKFFLPQKQQADILRELSENIRSQIEDKEAQLERPLDRSEQEALLKQYGHPMFFALRYRQSGRHLIGPVVFPFYWLAVKIALLFVGFGYAIGAVVLLTEGKPVVDALYALLSFFKAALPMFGWMTVIFAVLDYGQAKYGLLEKLNATWDPGSLPSKAKQEKPESRTRTIFNVVARVICTAWFLSGLQYPVLILGPAAAFMTFGPDFRRLLLPIALLSVVGIVISVRGRPLVRMAADSFGLLPFFWILVRGGVFFIPLDPAANEFTAIINRCAALGLWITLPITIAVLAWEAFKYFRGRNYYALVA
jgi:hypothetical protein